LAAGQAVQVEVDAARERGRELEGRTAGGEQRDHAGPVRPHAADQAQRVAGQPAEAPKIVQVGQLGVL
jgi:hypothetical protein